MKSDARPEEVRTLVLKTPRDLGVAVSHPLDLDERIVVTRGKYVARSYRSHQMGAMWFIDIGIVQFFDTDGRVLRVVNLFLEAAPEAELRRFDPSGAAQRSAAEASR